MFKFCLRTYISVYTFHLCCNTSLLLGSYLTLLNVMQITSQLIMDLLLVPNYLIALARYSAASQKRNQNKRTKELELVFACTLIFLFEKLMLRTFIFSRLIFASNYHHGSKFCHILCFAQIYFKSCMQRDNSGKKANFSNITKNVLTESK